MSQSRPSAPSNRLVDLLLLGSDYLASRGVETARLEAELLLGDLLNMDRVGLYLNFDRPLTEEEKNGFRDRLRQRVSGIPVQYILGSAEFYGIRLTVGPGVLIPRPETEGLVDRAKERMPADGFVNACDIGCGSGAVALALLGEGVVQQMVAVDVSLPAVRTTLANAQSLGFELPSGNGQTRHLTRTLDSLTQSLLVVEADAFAPGFTPPGAPFDLIVSNPPYIRADEMEALSPHIREHEPEVALVSGQDGLDAHRALAQALPGWLCPGGCFLGEIGSGQGPQALALHRNWAKHAELHKDLNGHDRIVEAWTGPPHE